MKNTIQENTGVREALKVDEWTGCYTGSWAKLIVPDAFSHP
jgi:hypothetical protein